jgi:ABC-2 type transport system permease protein
MFALFKKEVKFFLNSLSGYVVMGVFLVMTGLFLWIFPTQDNILDRGFSDLNGLFQIAPVVFLFLIPAITMRSFSEESKTGTIELLFTYPLTDLQIILAKYLASVFLMLISIIPTLVYFLTVYLLGYPQGNIDMGAMWGSYIGLHRETLIWEPCGVHI